MADKLYIGFSKIDITSGLDNMFNGKIESVLDPIFARVVYFEQENPGWYSDRHRQQGAQ